LVALSVDRSVEKSDWLEYRSVVWMEQRMVGKTVVGSVGKLGEKMVEQSVAKTAEKMVEYSVGRLVQTAAV
jgi:hypothetical protein